MARRLSLVLLTVVVSLVPRLASSAPITIDFETLSDSEVVTNQFAGVTFSNAAVLTSGVSLNEFEFPPFSGANVVFDDGGAMRIDFATAMTSIGGYFNYRVPLTLSAFNASNVLLGSVSSAFSANLALSGDVGSSPNEWLAFSGVGIAYVVLTGDVSGGSFTLDNLTYDNDAKAVPEPLTLTLLLLGGAAVVRKRMRA